jgi:hypothetical protein
LKGGISFVKELNRTILNEIAKKSGAKVETIDRIIGTLEITLARQASKEKDKCVVLDGGKIQELEETLKIGADITPGQAKAILAEVEKTVEQGRQGPIKFLDEGTFEFERGTITFRLSD